MQQLPYQHVRWVVSSEKEIKDLDITSDSKRIEDLKGNKLLLFTNPWNITWAEEHNKDLVLSEFGK